MKILIIGAGGHAQVVADIFFNMKDAGNNCTPIGYLDDNPRLQGRVYLGLPVLGPITLRSSIPHDAVIVAVGNNTIRKRLYEELLSQGEHFIVARHPHSMIARSASIGQGSMICAGVVVNPQSTIGVNVILNTGCTVDHHNNIGPHAHLAPGVHTGGEVLIGEGALMGISSAIMPRCSLGEWAIAGAGALIHRPFPANSVAIGVPAKIFSSGMKPRSKAE